MYPRVNDIFNQKSKAGEPNEALDDIRNMSVTDILRDLKNYADGERKGISISSPEVQRRRALRNQASYLYSELTTKRNELHKSIIRGQGGADALDRYHRIDRDVRTMDPVRGLFQSGDSLSQSRGQGVLEGERQRLADLNLHMARGMPGEWSPSLQKEHDALVSRSASPIHDAMRAGRGYQEPYALLVRLMNQLDQDPTISKDPNYLAKDKNGVPNRDKIKQRLKDVIDLNERNRDPRSGRDGLSVLTKGDAFNTARLVMYHGQKDYIDTPVDRVLKVRDERPNLGINQGGIADGADLIQLYNWEDDNLPPRDRTSDFDRAYSYWKAHPIFSQATPDPVSGLEHVGAGLDRIFGTYAKGIPASTAPEGGRENQGLFEQWGRDRGHEIHGALDAFNPGTAIQLPDMVRSVANAVSRQVVPNPVGPSSQVEAPNFWKDIGITDWQDTLHELAGNWAGGKLNHVFTEKVHQKLGGASESPSGNQGNGTKNAPLGNDIQGSTKTASAVHQLINSWRGFGFPDSASADRMTGYLAIKDFVNQIARHEEAAKAVTGHGNRSTKALNLSDELRRLADPSQPIQSRAIDDTFSKPEGPGGEKVSSALKAIYRVLDLELPYHNITLDSALEGHGEWNSGHIKINPEGSHPGLTTAHEVLHAIQRSIFLERPFDDFEYQHLSNEVYKSIYATTTFQILKALEQLEEASHNKKMAELPPSARKKFHAYWTSDIETMARAFSQYIAIKSDDPLLKTELADRLNEIKYGYPTQWTEQEFQGIAKKMDALFKHLGLMK